MGMEAKQIFHLGREVKTVTNVFRDFRKNEACGQWREKTEVLLW